MGVARGPHTCPGPTEFLGGAGIGPARVRVADVGGEEFEDAHRGAITGGDECRQHGRADRDQLAHDLSPAARRASTIRSRWFASITISAASAGSLEQHVAMRVRVLVGPYRTGK
jgi:hypothetical protein